MYVTQPWTIRQYAGFSTAEDSNAFYRRNLAAGQKGLSVAFDLATHRGYDSDHPRVAGDVGMAGVAIDSIYDMRTLFAGIPLDRMSVSMTMNGAVLPVLALYIVAAEEQGVPPRKARGHDPERHPQGVHGPQHLHLSAQGLDADHRRHLRLHVGATCRSSTRSRSPATTCRRPGRRRTSSSPTRSPTASSTSAPASRPGSAIDQFAPRLSFFWAIGMNFFMEVAKLRAARLLWAKLVKGFEPEDRQVAAAAHPLPDLRLVAHRAGRVQQRRPHLHRGDGGDAGPHAVAAHQRARRGARAADRLLGPHRPQHAALPAAGERHDAHHRSLGRLLLRRAADATSSPARPGTHIEEVEALGGMAKAIEAGIPKLRIEEAAARTQARIDSGAPDGRRRQQVHGRRTSADRRPARSTTRPCARCRSTSCKRLAGRARRGRRAGGARRAVAAAAASGDGNLLALAVEAARAKATVGEISDALEKVWGRHRAEIKAISGVYKREVGRDVRERSSGCAALVEAFEASDGRRPRILVAKMGQDGHDRGQKVIASAFADLGFDVDIGPLFATPARGGAPGGRERRAHRRRLVARRRPPDARAGAEGGARRHTAAPTS